MGKIPILSALLLRIKRRRVKCKPHRCECIDINGFTENIRRVTLKEWKDAIQREEQQK